MVVLDELHALKAIFLFETFEFEANLSSVGFSVVLLESDI